MLSPLPQRPSLLLWSSSSLRKPYVSARVLTLVKFTSTWMFGCLRCPYVRPSGMGVRIHKSIQKSIWCYRHWLKDHHYYNGHHHLCASLMSVHECLHLWSWLPTLVMLTAYTCDVWQIPTIPWRTSKEKETQIWHRFVQTTGLLTWLWVSVLTIWYFRPFGNAVLQCPRDLPSP